MRVLIADDHILIRDVIAMFLKNEGIEEVVTASDLDEAYTIAETSPPFDLICLDYDMPGMNGMEGLDRIKSLNADVPVAIMSGTSSPLMVSERAVKAGAAGFLPKTIGAKAMAHAVRFMAIGEVFVPYEIIRAAEKGFQDGVNLNEREREVLFGICEGLSNKEIGRDLDLQEVTIKMHVKNLMRKFNARNRAHVVTLAKERALV